MSLPDTEALIGKLVLRFLLVTYSEDRKNASVFCSDVTDNELLFSVFIQLDKANIKVKERPILEMG